MVVVSSLVYLLLTVSPRHHQSSSKTARNDIYSRLTWINSGGKLGIKARLVATLRYTRTRKEKTTSFYFQAFWIGGRRDGTEKISFDFPRNIRKFVCTDIPRISRGTMEEILNSVHLLFPPNKKRKSHHSFNHLSRNESSNEFEVREESSDFGNWQKKEKREGSK